MSCCCLPLSTNVRADRLVLSFLFDPATDYDTIIHMYMFYRLDSFQVALGYNSMFTQLV